MVLVAGLEFLGLNTDSSLPYWILPDHRDLGRRSACLHPTDRVDGKACQARDEITNEGPAMRERCSGLRRQASPAVALVVVLAVCSEPDKGEASNTGDAGSAPCYEAQLRTDGTCCPAGHFYDYDDDACHPVGPPECAQSIFTAPLACRPRWCWSGVGEDGGACDPVVDDDCQFIGRVCSAEELAAGAGCDAGMVPSHEVPDTCVPAGYFAGSGVPMDWDGDPGALAPVSSPPTMADAVAAGVPPLIELPEADDTFFCRDNEQATPHFCGASELPLCERGAGGALPDPARCVLVGVPWESRYCPPGFIVDTAAKVGEGALPPCKADPLDCGADPYGDSTLQDAPGVFFVDGAAGDDSAAGSRDAPLRTIAAALAQAPALGTIAVAAGTYTESLVIDKALTLRGRCAAMVTVAGPAGAYVSEINAGAGQGNVGVTGIRFTGPGEFVYVTAKVPVTLERVWIDGVRSVGLGVSGEGTVVDARSMVIQGTLPRAEDGNFGTGVEAGGAARLTLTDVRVSRNRFLGLNFLGGSDVTALRVLIDGTLPQESDQAYGYGASVAVGSSLSLTSARVQGNRGIALRFSDPGTIVEVTRTLVDLTRPQEDNLDLGIGIAVQNRAKVTVVETRLSANRTCGLVAFAEGTALDGSVSDVAAERLIIDHTSPRLTTMADGYGTMVGAGARLTVKEARLSQNRSAGLYVTGSGAEVNATAVLVDGTLPRLVDLAVGTGVVANKGAVVKLSGGRLAGNLTAGLFVEGPGTKATADALVVDGTLPQKSDGGHGRGVIVQVGAFLAMKDAYLIDNADIGLSVGAGAGAIANRLVVDGTPGQGSKGTGHTAILVGDGGGATLTDVRVLGNHSRGVVAQLPATTVRLRRVAIDVGEAGGNSDPAIGIRVTGGAQAILDGVRVTGAHVGIAGDGAQTNVAASGILVDHTRDVAGQGSGAGIGVYLESGAGLALSGGRVVSTREAAVAAFFPSELRLVGLDVRETLANAAGEWGTGLGLLASAQPFLIASCRFEDSHSTAVTLWNPSGTISNSVLVATAPASHLEFDPTRGATGEFDAVADGLLVMGAPALVIDRLLIADNVRAGVTVVSSDDVRVERTAASGGAYGLVNEGASTLTTSGSFFRGSVFAEAADVGLALPAAPQPAHWGGSP